MRSKYYVGYKFLTSSGLARIEGLSGNSLDVFFYETENVKRYSRGSMTARVMLKMVDPKGRKYDNPQAYYPDFRHDANQATYVYRGHTGKPNIE